MSEEYKNTIEYMRPEFYKAALSANTLLSLAKSALESGNTTKAGDCNIRATLKVREAEALFVELRDAYAADLARMERVIKSIRHFEVTDEL